MDAEPQFTNESSHPATLAERRSSRYEPPEVPAQPLLTRPFVLASVAHFLHGLSYYFLLAMPGFLKDRGATEFEIGLTVGSAGLTAILTRPAVGRLMDTRGRLGVMWGGGAIAAVTSLLYLFIHGFGIPVVAVRMVHGVAEAMLFASLFAYAADIVPEARRIEGIALFGVSGLVPMAVGSALGDVILRASSYQHLFVCAALAAFVATGITFFLRESHRPAVGDEAPRGVLASVREPSLLPLWIAGLAFATALAGPFVFMKTFVKAQGNGDVAPFFVAYGLTATTIRLFFGHAPERFGPKRVLLPAVVAFLLGLSSLAFGASPVVLALAGFGCGLGHGFVFPILLGLVVTRARSGERGSALSVFTALFDGGSLLGGPMLGAMAKSVGYGPMFLSAAAVAAVGVVAFYLLDRGRGNADAPVPG